MSTEKLEPLRQLFGILEYCHIGMMGHCDLRFAIEDC